MGRTLLIVALLYLSPDLSAQVKTAVQFGNNDGSALQQDIADNLSKLLTEMNTAFVDRRDIHWEDINISVDARNRISTLWNTSRFRCTETVIEENLLQTPSGQFQIRQIPLQLERFFYHLLPQLLYQVL